jgi:hypothetical protein
MTSPFEIQAFAEDSFHAALCNETCPQVRVAKSRQVAYLCGYLQAIRARTIVIEHEYTDGDYLDDFASYYVKCFRAYRRRCKRIHFFSEPISPDKFLNAVRGALGPDEQNALESAYLGFIVARPLPDAIVGRTLLRTYDSDNGRRHYPCTKRYSANLFGVELSVCTLPFQEQDSVLAACATVSLWCCFHKTADLFGTPIPTPAMITRMASQAVQHARPIPSHALNVFQMCTAVAEVGLEPEMIEMKGSVPLVSLVCGYLHLGLPVVLLVNVPGVGDHAITVTGYSLREQIVHTQEVGPGEACIPMIGLRVDEFYAHDDQIGPFSKLNIKIGPPVQVNHIWTPFSLEGSWKDAQNTVTPLRVLFALIPVYHKIRVTFLDLQTWLTRLDSTLASLVLGNAGQREWEAYLTTSNEYKRSIRNVGIKSEQMMPLLLMQHPRFCWRAMLTVAGLQAVELLVDATDMARSMPVYQIIWHDQNVKVAVASLMADPGLDAQFSEALTPTFFVMLKESVGN